MRKIFLLVLVFIALFICFALALQLIPYGRNHENPKVPLHPEASLNVSEKQTLLAGLRATFGGENRGGRRPSR